ncbi:MAG: methylmalonyl-CoA carboxyltransferase [Chloroflexi bacterium]|nr:methylmalonyl-CoA carboxyltransferase [Chloroflexota bacterium]
MRVEKGIPTSLEKLTKMRDQARAGGGEKRIEQQHAKGKLIARERVALLVDEGSFEEVDPFVVHRATDFGLDQQKIPGDAVVTGYGRVDGRLVFLFAQDFTVLGGSVSEAVGQKIYKIMDMAMKVGAPVVGLNDSGGARIQEGVDSLAAYGGIFLRNVLASGVIPQISVILGPAAGGAVYSPALTDFVFMVKGVGQMYITGPDVIKAVTGEQVSHEELGGAEVHATKSGVAHFVYDNESACLQAVRRLLGFLPLNNADDPPRQEPADDPERRDPSLRTLVPEDPVKSYDMLQLVYRVVDDGDFMEVHQQYAQNMLVGFARMNGSPVGVVAQQPMVLAGVIDIDASVKGARFVRFCDAFNIPIVTFVDVPGYMPGLSQEHGGIIKHGAKLLYAYAEATAPKVTILVRKAYGGAYIVMGSKHLRGDVNLAWPTGEVAVMGPEGAVNILYRDLLSKSEEPEETRKKLIKEFKGKLANPYIAATRGYLDDVIDPAETRPRIVKALNMLQNKRDTLPPKKHGNIPL